ncbi:MAG TPA: tripartite tricarboxylate transporter substrate binding protein [Burkholderiales bacterium]|nr:tripartite tricarboxylate transporter substrate binding protein [Burkholderiales bacterium]
MTRRWCIALLIAAVTGNAGAQAFPAKPVRVIVPFSPGGPADFQVRLLAPRLTEAWGQQIIVDNRGGANGIIAFELGAKADPDGHTLILITAGFTINATLYPKLPYDSRRDFEGVTQLASAPGIVVVHPSVPARSVKELVALAKSRPGQIIYMSAGVGAPSHLAVELLKTMTGINMIHVPYKGIAPGIVDLLAGQVQVSIPTILAGLTHAKAGRLRALATTGANRAPAAPDLPTMPQAGFPGYEAANWFGMVVPAKTPPAIITRLNQDFARALNTPDVREKMLTQGMEPVSKTSEAFSKYIQSEITKWAGVVKTSGAKPE